jgi:hypothetical protein
LADTNFPSKKNVEVENFQLLTMTVLENFLEWKSGNGPLLSLTSKLELNSASAE